MVEKTISKFTFLNLVRLNPLENYGQMYIRTDNIEKWYELAITQKLNIPVLEHLQVKPWPRKSFRYST